jgi:hypothetical protein
MSALWMPDAPAYQSLIQKYTVAGLHKKAAGCRHDSRDASELVRATMAITDIMLLERCLFDHGSPIALI